mmetsp:Transcript_32558/g.105187  ORF Transcript_32558/g.105187 Transcript_32558/m.105187 type:complete len:208 (-) Transcript_32558:239-862(-)|eukprot:scaffold3114_cov114-Isochrysis_galbana.AAC.14
MTIQLGNGIRRIFLVVKVDEGEPTRLLRLLVLGQVDALNASEEAEELTQVRILDFLRQVRDTHSARVVALRHLRVARAVGVSQARWDIPAWSTSRQGGEAAAASATELRPVAGVARNNALRLGPRLRRVDCGIAAILRPPGLKGSGIHLLKRSLCRLVPLLGNHQLRLHVKDLLVHIERHPLAGVATPVVPCRLGRLGAELGPLPPS